MRRSLLAFLAVIAISMLPAKAHANVISYDLDFAFSGATPDSGTPYLQAFFLDGTDCLGVVCDTNTVQLLLKSSLEDTSEFVTEWDFNSSNLDVTVAFNSDSIFNAGSYTAPTIKPTISNNYQADGDGKYDFSIVFDTPNTGRFNLTDQALFTITGTDINVGTFDLLSAPGGNSGGPFHTAAHIQGIQTCSGWVGDTVAGSTGSSSGPCGTPVPEPASVILLSAGVGILAAFGYRRKRVSLVAR
jgi:hypothetical protein